MNGHPFTGAWGGGAGSFGTYLLHVQGEMLGVNSELRAGVWTREYLEYLGTSNNYVHVMKAMGPDEV